MTLIMECPKVTKCLGVDCEYSRYCEIVAAISYDYPLLTKSKKACVLNKAIIPNGTAKLLAREILSAQEFIKLCVTVK